MKTVSEQISELAANLDYMQRSILVIEALKREIKAPEAFLIYGGDGDGIVLYDCSNLQNPRRWRIKAVEIKAPRQRKKKRS